MDTIIEKSKNIWLYFSNLGIDSSLTQQDIRITRLINRFAFSILFLVLFSFVYQVIKHLLISGIILPHTIWMLFSFMPFALIFVLNHKRKYFLARLTFVVYPLIKTTIWMFVSNSQAGNIHYSFLLYTIPIMILFRNIRTQVLLISLTYIAFITSHLIQEFNPRVLDSYHNPHFGFIVFGVWLGISFVMLRFFVQEIERTEYKLQQKNVELEEFASIASHDLKEPLRTIESFSKLIKVRHKAKLPEEAVEFFGFIESGTNRMNNLLNDLSKFSMINKEGENLSAVNLNEILASVLQNLQASIYETNADITSNELPIIKANPNHMIQLFQNIISNSIKFQPLDKNLNPIISVNSHIENECYVIEFQDNGIGIPKKNLEQVFGKFRRLHTRDEYDGTGLGLATCKKIVEYYYGKITVESELNVGTCITVRFIKC